MIHLTGSFLAGLTVGAVAGLAVGLVVGFAVAVALAAFSGPDRRYHHADTGEYRRGYEDGLCEGRRRWAPGPAAARSRRFDAGEGGGA